MEGSMEPLPSSISLRPEDAEWDDGGGEALSSTVFQAYQCCSVAEGQPHPGDIAEPASLAAIPLPPNDYPLDALPAELISSGKLSSLQLEGMRYACARHLNWLSSGERQGFFLGDGAGVGKGRQISAIILDNYARGRGKHVWLSTSTDLYQDAVRDLKDLGCHIPVIQNVQALDKATNTPREGVMFIIKGRTRLQQVVQWLGGPSFNGALVFDESKNFVPGKEAQSTRVALNVLEIQALLPAARVVYCSATGNEVGNLAYMSRLGLWGVGSSFPDFDSFLSSMRRRGVTFMEMLAMEMKGQGLYLSRGLSFREAEFAELACPLTPAQIAQYDAAVALWQDTRAALVEALAATGNTRDVWKPYYGAVQRFFKILLVSMKVPCVVAEARKALDSGFAVVIGLQSTGEAAADALGIDPGTPCGFISTCREIGIQFIANHFPYLVEAQTGEEVARHPDMPTPSLVPGSAKLGAGDEEPESSKTRARLQQAWDSADLPPNFLDQLIDELGGAAGVAEMTGRKARVVRDARGTLTYSLRAKPDSAELDSLNIREKAAFMEGSKLVAIVSDAASTGISLHASAAVKNRRRRAHLTIELPWSADKAIQQLGRSHRANQVSAPKYSLVHTDVGGEARFAAAVARRLQSLGALTRGDRRAASGLDLSSLNLDSPVGRRALRRMYDALVQDSPLLPPGVRLEALVDAVLRLHGHLRGAVGLMGIGLSAPRGDTVAEANAGIAGGKDQGDVRRFLNRMLCLHVAEQNLLFDYFQATLAAEIRSAKAEGKYFEGVSDLPGQDISREGEPHVLWVDPLSTLSTMQHDLSVDRGLPFAEAAAQLARATDGASGFMVSKRPSFGRTSYILALQKARTPGTFSIARPNTGASFFDMDLDELRAKYLPCAPEAAEAGWEQWYHQSLEIGRRRTPVTVLTGSIVRIWDCLERVLTRHEAELSRSDRVMRIVRVDLGDGSLPIIGVRYPGFLLPEVVMLLAVEQQIGAAGRGRAASSLTTQRRVEAVDPVVPRLLSKAYCAPRTVLDFFKPGAAVPKRGPEALSGGAKDAPTCTQRQELMDMGFAPAKADLALKVCGGDVERAANWLLTSAATLS
ncbi:Strawberry notch-like protein 1 [Auxenochlorella protothecoides]|uniref:Strawberry notch-like protein 1 n=1 Tax=Auxenochlorella protothecoides TaxID=3075 RepID=A0A087SBX4_AUXPR|nr:Strawberry notch-like protein 1 [Auxenochlorella protothecoides]KFM23228.1 Strawberry notch-like protein 1 [Auxenochlorella protothecoides]